MRFKLTDQNNSLLLDLNFRTALLESVDWDESQSASLLQYLEVAVNNNKEKPEDILDHIRSNYGEPACLFIKNMFLDVYIEHGMYRKKGDYYEH